MKISAKARYGLRILLDIALYANEKPRSIKEIAQSQQISEKFISRLVVDLRKAGFLDSVRGAQGGLKLAKFPKFITLLDVVETMDGPVSLLDCITSPSVCPRQRTCIVSSVWGKVNQSLTDALRGITLEQIVQQYTHAPEGTINAADDYCI